jgi:beta-lactam-binding protein with PASTA domain
MGSLGFLADKKFYIHLGISVGVSLALLLIVIGLLRTYTRHGDAYLVPDLSGMTLAEIQDDRSMDLFRFQITDSVYDNSQKPGSVIKQNPSPGSKAKEGRTIYITIVSFTPEMSIMPELKDMTIRQAVTTLKASGIKVRMLRFVPHFAENSVLGHYFEGDTLMSGTEILEGSEIDLVVGLGENRQGGVPYLLGMTRDQAHAALNMASFNVGREHFLEQFNPRHSRVYRQFPWFNSEMYPGDSVTLYYRSDVSFNFDSLKSRVTPDTAVIMEAGDTLEITDEF